MAAGPAWKASESTHSLGQVLAAFAARSGQLLGARRWPENPLTLTHVRWQGADGSQLEASRRLSDADDLDPPDHEIWVQLALDCPVGYETADQAQQANWVALATTPRRAGEMLRALGRGRSSGSSLPGLPGMSGPVSGSPYVPPSRPAGLGAFAAPPSGPPRARGAGQPSASPTPSAPSVSPASSGALPTSGELPRDASQPSLDPRATTGAFPRQAFAQREVTVVPCVEIELPLLLASGADAHAVRTFALDVTSHFSRACHGIPQVREVRGWMRGARMVLAARMAVAPGSRPPSRAEMEGAAHILADTLAQRTIPFARLGFAEPGEWATGAALPD